MSQKTLLMAVATASTINRTQWGGEDYRQLQRSGLCENDDWKKEKRFASWSHRTGPVTYRNGSKNSPTILWKGIKQGAGRGNEATKKTKRKHIKLLTKERGRVGEGKKKYIRFPTPVAGPISLVN